MSEYITGLFANSPLLTYTPPVGFDASTGWVNKPFVDEEPQYVTSAPKASVSFDFCGDQFELSGFLTPAISDNTPPCDFNVTINGVLQHQNDFYSPYNDLPLDHYHVELTFFCPHQGQQASFAGPALVETQGTVFMSQANPYLDTSQIYTLGPWTEKPVYQNYFAMTFPQYTTTDLGSTLAYRFKGVHTQVFGIVGPNCGEYVVTLDGQLQPPHNLYNPVGGDVTVIFFAQELDNDKTHTVTLTNLGKNMTIQAIQYTKLFPYTGGK
ncbi:hypothetical protein DACRYDRAFT_107974 [Dacryopinax primogenitus]|uniref:Uncharacterized protein n=1 Tax=Dacryopinax primogenitus (strain DJM 731) TaxID=1858805 RepID=M5GBN6_DACPD|nr:uncharacterized protein DACRYDRAFT_107974 [Dacryopinax primogenitus]EJU01423.1 hypothetical protein DACRYDRAFT_107974 [Dacryopinax primogenitus]